MILVFIHLNFFSDYLNFKFYGSHNSDISLDCKLCGEEQRNRAHHVVDCFVTLSVFQHYMPIFKKIVAENLTKEEMAFGFTREFQFFDKKCLLRNYITFSIRDTLFKNRAVNFGTVGNAISSIISLSRIKITKDLRNRWNFAVGIEEKEKFVSDFLINNIVLYI